MNTPPPGRGSATDPASDGEAFAAAAHALGVGIVEHESGGEIVLAPVHRRSDQIEQRTGIDEQYVARGFDPSVHRAGVRHIIHRIEIGRALSRERVCQYGYSKVVAASVNTTERLVEKIRVVWKTNRRTKSK